MLKRLRADERGVSVVELGLIAPVLALFIAGMIDLSQGLAQRFAMQQAVNRSLELLMANPPEAAADEDDVDYTFVTEEAAAAADVPTTAVTLVRWLQCDGVEAASYDETCDPGQDTARYISLSVEKEFNGAFFIDSMTMTATGVVRIQ
ncbi:MAG: pilus assembly protein [Pseudomonadota bacterium]|nr:pilus assembly protein [Pseudomonadota bacterium]